MKFKSKTLTLEHDSKISPTVHNYSKMTTFEVMYCQIFIWETVGRHFKSIFKDTIESLKSFSSSLLDIILIPLFPIALYISAKKEIKEAKQEVQNYRCWDCKSHDSSICGLCDGCKLIDGEPTKYIECVGLKD